jgi:protein-tyrosine phosphatase
MTLRVLTLCTHNRTRSVLMGALLESQLRVTGVDAAVRSAGTIADDQPATATTVRLLAARGLDVSGHIGRLVTEDDVRHAELIVAAEVAHVVHVAGRWPGSFDRVFTLPELVARGEAAGPRRGRPLSEWLALVGAGRHAGIDYLSDPTVLEVPDPTGYPPEVWQRSFAQIDDLCTRLARLLA